MLTLSPIPWGRKDAALSRVVLRHMVDANPPVVIPWRPGLDKLSDVVRVAGFRSEPVDVHRPEPITARAHTNVRVRLALAALTPRSRPAMLPANDNPQGGNRCKH